MATAWYKRWTTWAALFFTIPCVGCLAFNAVVFLPGKHRADRANRAACVELIAGLDRYRAANGRFPGSLDALVPSFLPALPEQVDITGRASLSRFAYAITGSGAEFRLSFEDAPMMPMDDGRPTETWSSKTNIWTKTFPPGG